MPTSAEQKAQGWLSVTEVLDAFIPKGLLDWYLRTGKKEAKRLSTVAMKIGSRVDELIQQDIEHREYKFNSKDSIEVKNCMEAWESFKRDYNPLVTQYQVEVKDEAHKVIGHIDLILNNRVVDVKCAASIKQNYWLQVAAYSEMYPPDVDGVAILRLDKNLGTYEYKTNEQAEVNWTECVEVFDGLLKAYRYYQPKGQEE